MRCMELGDVITACAVIAPGITINKKVVILVVPLLPLYYEALLV